MEQLKQMARDIFGETRDEGIGTGCTV